MDSHIKTGYIMVHAWGSTVFLAVSLDFYTEKEFTYSVQ